MYAITRHGPPAVPKDRSTSPVPRHGNSPQRRPADSDELLLCSVLESLAELETRFAADLGRAGLRTVRRTFQAIGAVYCARAVSRVAGGGSPAP